jgi:hypothetical protein
VAILPIRGPVVPDMHILRATVFVTATLENFMSGQPFDAEKLTSEIRKFLKTVGITSQVEIEHAVRRALEEGRLDVSKPLHAVMVLDVPALGLQHKIEHQLALD